MNIARLLADLEWHWGSAYKISCQGGMWRADRRGAPVTLLAPSQPALRDLIRLDYYTWKLGSDPWQVSSS